VILCAALLAVLPGAPARGHPDFETKINASDAAAADVFGLSVAITGDTALVGAGGNDDDGLNSGSAYLFGRNQGGADNWGEIVKLTASDATADDVFGDSVAISENTVIVGAFGNDDDGDRSGSAYIFDRNHGGTDNWGEVKKLTASDAAQGDEFGNSVSIYGNIAIVGASQNNNDVVLGGHGVNNGLAYIFHRNQGGADNWGEVVKLTPSETRFNNRFGTSVSISGDIAIVGAPRNDGAGHDSGSVYIFARSIVTSKWNGPLRLTLTDAVSDDQFGQSVSISGDRLHDLDSHWIVGAPFRNDAGNDSGSAYIVIFPEPTTLWLFALGSIALLRRRATCVPIDRVG
jgi:hypothetical protein